MIVNHITVEHGWHVKGFFHTVPDLISTINNLSIKLQNLKQHEGACNTLTKLMLVPHLNEHLLSIRLGLAMEGKKGTRVE